MTHVVNVERVMASVSPKPLHLVTAVVGTSAHCELGGTAAFVRGFAFARALVLGVVNEVW